MHTVPRMHMAADETHTRLPSNTSTPDRYGQPACQHNMAGASFTRRARTCICTMCVYLRALRHNYDTLVAYVYVGVRVYICILYRYVYMYKYTYVYTHIYISHCCSLVRRRRSVAYTMSGARRDR